MFSLMKRFIALHASRSPQYGRFCDSAVRQTVISWSVAACQMNLLTAVWNRMPTEYPKIVPIRKMVYRRPDEEPSAWSKRSPASFEVA